MPSRRLRSKVLLVFVVTIGAVVFLDARNILWSPRASALPRPSDEATVVTTPPANSTTTQAPTTTTPPTQTSSPATSGQTAPTSDEAPAQPSYGFTTESITLVDQTRSSPARGDVPGSSSRTLRTLILRPIGVNDPPVVVFAHGFNSEPETYLPLLQTWVSAGYLVVAPEFPGSASNLPGSPVETDIAEQALDVSFVITQLLAGAAGPVNPSRIAVAGHSDGGSTIAVLALNPDYADPRISAYLVLSGAIPSTVEGSWGTTSTPGTLLAVVGDEDEYGNLPATTEVADTAQMTKALITVPGGDHLDTYLDADPQAAAVRAATVDFLDLTIGGSTPPSEDQLTQTLDGTSNGAYDVSTASS